MRQIDPIALQKLINEQPDLFLLDVREPHEHEDFHIGGTLIPLPELMQRSAEIPADKTVVVYCRKGIRSQIAIQRLEQRMNTQNFINLEGGIECWKKQFGA